MDFHWMLQIRCAEPWSGDSSLPFKQVMADVLRKTGKARIS